jgi:hypothetical protein
MKRNYFFLKGSFTLSQKTIGERERDQGGQGDVLMMTGFNGGFRVKSNSWDMSASV